MVIFDKLLGSRRLLIILSIVLAVPLVTVVSLASIITITNSHVLSLHRVQRKLATATHLIVPTKLGHDTTRIANGVQLGTPSALTGLAKVESTQLQNIVDNFSTEQGVAFGVYVKDLKSNAIAQHNQDAVFPAASLYKLYVADLVFHQIDLGKIFPNNQAGNSGYSIHDCLDRMIMVSDNDCGIALGNIVQWNLSNPIIIARGYTRSNLNDPPQTTAGDTGKLLEHLYQQLDETSNTDQLIFLELLKQQQLNRRLPAGLPPGTIIAHKTGDLDSYVHDVGIVYGAKTNYIISVLSGPWPDTNAAPDAFAALSQRVYQLIEH